jgi:imidazolonepropionase-like amidohydrolase
VAEVSRSFVNRPNGWWVLAAAASVLGCTGQRPAPDPSAPDLVLANVTVIDGLGHAAAPGRTIEVRAGRITAVRPAAAGDRSSLAVAGSFVTPGLIDSHVHYDPLHPDAVRAGLDSLIRSGITTVREMACCAADYASFAAVWDTTRLPRMYWSAFWGGPAFMRDDPRIKDYAGRGRVPWLLAVTDTTDLDAAMQGAVSARATGIKIYSDLSADLVRRIASTAHRHGLRVWSHSTVFPTRPSEVVAADVDVISHAALFVWEGAATPPKHYDGPHRFNPFGPPEPWDAVEPRDPRIVRVLEVMRRRGIILDPTVAVMKEAVGAIGMRWTVALTKLAHEMAIPIAAGTDGVSLFDELETLVDSVGFTPLEALTSATSIGARAIGVAGELGTVQVGKIADLVIHRSDPSEDIRRLRGPSQVFKNGRLVVGGPGQSAR